MALVRVRDRNELVEAHRGDEQIFADFRTSIARKTRGFLAPEYNIQMHRSRGANQPFDEGLARPKRKLFMELMTGPQSAAQRYYFFAERAANKIPDIAKDTPLIDVQQGRRPRWRHHGWRHRDELRERRDPRHDRRTRPGVARSVASPWSGRTTKRSRSTTAEQVEERMALITGSTSETGLRRLRHGDRSGVRGHGAEAVDLQASSTRSANPAHCLASNTSALDVNEIARPSRAAPSRVIGMHFFSPANVMKLLENVRGDKSSDSVVATTMAIGKKIKKGVRDGRGVPRLRRQPDAVHASAPKPSGCSWKAPPRPRSTPCCTTSASRWVRSR